MSDTLDDTRYLQLAEQAMAAIESAADAADLDSKRDGAVLRLELDGGDQIIVNLQQPTHQLWLASRAGAHHYVWNGAHWCDTRTGETLGAALQRVMRTLDGPELDVPSL
ncbi:iron donor protein CyaY [Thiomonas sp.]|jgi:CyaY protein|uniref:iron donor protein CyaY n=1 Tax=Thiomonas sp. TaxID=2047785 RepID=UPI00262366A8|nr:iron donor protein CyaY [Thiomonas sp.]